MQSRRRPRALSWGTRLRPAAPPIPPPMPQTELPLITEDRFNEFVNLCSDSSDEGSVATDEADFAAAERAAVKLEEDELRELRRVQELSRIEFLANERAAAAAESGAGPAEGAQTGQGYTKEDFDSKFLSVSEAVQGGADDETVVQELSGISNEAKCGIIKILQEKRLIDKKRFDGLLSKSIDFSSKINRVVEAGIGGRPIDIRDLASDLLPDLQEIFLKKLNEMGFIKKDSAPGAGVSEPGSVAGEAASATPSSTVSRWAGGRVLSRGDTTYRKDTTKGTIV